MHILYINIYSFHLTIASNNSLGSGVLCNQSFLWFIKKKLIKQLDSCVIAYFIKIYVFIMFKLSLYSPSLIQFVYKVCWLINIFLILFNAYWYFSKDLENFPGFKKTHIFKFFYVFLDKTLVLNLKLQKLLNIILKNWLSFLWNTMP